MSEKAPARAARGSRIKPANLCQLPSVLDTKEAASVLRVDVCTVRELTKDGRLRRLAYSPRFYYYNREVERFLEEQTEAEPKRQQREKAS